MAQIDPSIAMGFRPPQIESPVNQMAAIAQLQGLRQQQQQNALKMQEYQQMQQEQNALAELYGNRELEFGSDEFLRRAAIVAPRSFEGIATRAGQRENVLAQKAAREAETKEREFKLKQSEAAATKENFQTAVTELLGYESLTDVVNDIYEKEVAGEITPQQAAALRSRLPKDDSGLDAWRTSTLRGLLPPKERLEFDKPMVIAPGGRLVSRTGDELYAAPDREKESDLARLQRERATIAETNPEDPRLKQYDAAIAKATATNQPLSDLARKQNELAMLEEELKADPNNKGLQQRIKEYRDDIRKDTQFRPVTNVSVAAPVTPVTIQDPNDPSKAIVVDGRTGKVIGASVKEGPGVDLTAKERQTREAKYPQATTAIKTYESKSEELAKDLETLANHPGLDGISGAIFGRTPSGTKNSMAAQEKYNSIVARGGFKELADMRASSPTGGALGNVSNQEGQFLRDAFASIGRTQSKDDLAAALKEAAKRVRESKERVREAYDMTYEYRSNAAPKAPAADPLGIRR